MTLDIDPPAVPMILGIMHLDILNLCPLSKNEISLMVKAAERFVKNDYKSTHFRATAFERHVTAFLVELQVYQSELGKERCQISANVIQK